MKKRGVSSLITVILIILIIIVLIIIIWNIIMSLLEREGEEINIDPFLLNGQIEEAVVDVDENREAKVVIKRGSGGDRIKGIKLVFKNEDGKVFVYTNTAEGKNPVEQLERRTYFLDSGNSSYNDGAFDPEPDNFGNITEISLYYIYHAKGKDRITHKMDDVELMSQGSVVVIDCPDDDFDGKEACDALGDPIPSCHYPCDCDDDDPNIRPGIAELCDDVDHNCDGNNYEGLAEDCEAGCLAAGGENYNPLRGVGYKCCGNDAGEGGPFEDPESTCDGNDNDCDAVTDEGFGPEDCQATCSVAGGENYNPLRGVGYKCCGNDAGEANPFEDPESTCDGNDNDCDSVTDEGFTVENCEPVCTAAGGEDYDGSRGVGLKCCGNDVGEGGPFEDPESTCDGNDNDCDAVTDEGFGPEDCQATCSVAGGVNYDGSRGVGYKCCGDNAGEANPFEDPESTCDGNDNDCDAVTDEGFGPEDCQATCSVAGGVNYDGSRGFNLKCCGNDAFEASPFQDPESTCDGNDNDCDSVIDEGFTAENCGPVCLALGGVNYDGSRGFNLKCCGNDVGENNPFQDPESTCDGRDNDCDSVTDEGFTAENCGPVCFAAGGEDYDGSRGIGYKCCGDNAGEGGPFEATESACDGNDNDCDGFVDEHFNCVQSSPNLISWWKFNGNYLDSSPVAPIHTGTPVGNAQIINNELVLDGSWDYVNLGDLYNELDGASAFSISFWIKPDVLPFVGYPGIFGRGSESAGSNAPRVPWIYGEGGLNSLELHIHTTNGMGGYLLDCGAGSMDLTEDVWQHVVAVWDSNECFFYVNKVEGVKESSLTSQVLGDTDGFNYIGHINNYQQFDGSLDEVMVFNKALNFAEVEEIYSNQQKS